MNDLPAPTPLNPVPSATSLPRREPRRRGRWLRLGLGLIVLVGLIVAGIRFFPRAATNNGPLTYTATRGDLVITITERGELESSQSVEVKCEVEGRQNKLVTIVPEGARVSKGQEVARFDTEDFQKALSEQEVKWKQAEGKAKAAKSDLDVTKNKAGSEIDKAELALKLTKLDRNMYVNAEYKAEVDEKSGALELARRDKKEAEDDLEFTKNLVKKGFTPQESLRLKQLGLQQKMFAVSRDESKLKLLQDYQRERKITELEGKAREAESELQRTRQSQAAAIEKAKDELEATTVTAELEKTQLERVRKQMERCIVLAPQEGIVVYFKRPWDDGSSRIQPGAILHYQQPIFTLPDLSKMRVKLKVHESVIKKITPGLKATIQIEALPNEALKGTVKSVGTLAQTEFWRSGVKEYQTEIDVENLPVDSGLKPGFTAEVKIHVQTIPDVVMIPVQAVAELDGEHVCFVGAVNSPEKRVIKVGESNEQFVEVKEGLEAGESVALDARARANALARKATPVGPASKGDKASRAPTNR